MAWKSALCPFDPGYGSRDTVLLSGIRQAAMKRMDDYRATSGITDGQKDTDDLVYTDEYGEWNYISYRTVLQEVGLPLLVVVVTVILGLAALLLPLIPSLEIGKGIFSRIPLEINFFLLFRQSGRIWLCWIF